MTDLLIMQSYGSPPDMYQPWLQLTRPLHQQYADGCGADYELFVGRKDDRVHPAWNRLPMFLDAFDRGYRKVVWLDADSIVVDPTANIFDHTFNETPLQMTRTSGFPWPVADGEREAWNDGVLVANNTPEARAAFEWVWARRLDPLRPHHIPSMWELSWLLDYVFEHESSIVGELHDRWNWMPFAHASPESGAAIKSFHGMPHRERWERFQATYDQLVPTP